ncbi:MAG: hypothetical protein ABS894_00845 [Aerococcus urinaeequi]
MKNIKVKLMVDVPIMVAGGVMGTLVSGYYVVNKTDSGRYVIAEGLYRDIELPHEKCRVVEMKEYEIEYVTELEIKLSKAGQELVEARKYNESMKQAVDEAKPRLVEAERVISGVHHLLTYIGEESVGFEVDPGTPLGSLEKIRRVLKRQSEEIRGYKENDKDWKEEINHIGKNLKEFLLSLDYNIDGEDVRGLSDMLRVVYDEWKENALRKELNQFLADVGYDSPHEYGPLTAASMMRDVYNDMKNQKGVKKVSVPSNVGGALDTLLSFYDRNYVFGQILQWTTAEESQLNSNSFYITDFKTVSKWHMDGNATNLLNLMLWGYEVEKTEREIRNEKLTEVFEAYGRDEYTVEHAMELIEKLYEGEEV